MADCLTREALIAALFERIAAIEIDSQGNNVPLDREGALDLLQRIIAIVDK